MSRYKLTWLFALNLFFALLLYGRTLPYTFVFDDHDRIEENAAVKSIFPISRFFLDPKTQADDNTMSHHTYRPLTTISFAIDYALWRDNPMFYRLENIVLHAINGALLGWIGYVLFRLSWPAAAMSSLFFLLHPLQTEAVAWISGRSDVLSFTFILLGWVGWIRFQNRRGYINAAIIVVCFGSCLLTREIGICFPILIVLGDLALRDQYDSESRRKNFIFYCLLASMAVLYVDIRFRAIGRLAQIDFWGGTFVTNIANVMQTWPLYLEKIVWPSELRVVYWSIPVLTHWSLQAVAGAVSLTLFLISIGLLWKIKKELSVLLMLVVVFWIPASNIVPVATQFAERLLYAPLAFISLAMGVLIENLQKRWLYKTWAALLVIVFGTTFSHLRTWKNDVTLWENVIHYEPQNWWAWYMEGVGEFNQADADHNEKTARGWLARAQNSFERSLNIPMPRQYIGAILMYLALVTDRLGNHSHAQTQAEQALRLNPTLQKNWDEKRPPQSRD